MVKFPPAVQNPMIQFDQYLRIAYTIYL